jgi:hypothetical protein
LSRVKDWTAPLRECAGPNGSARAIEKGKEMNLKLKALGLALFAALAMSAVAVSSASAKPVIAKAGVASGTVTAEGNEDIFTAGAGSEVKCTSAKYEGTFTSPSSTLTVTPSWSGCTAFGFTAHVTDTGCNYLFHLTEAHHPTIPAFTAGATLECPEPTSHIIITVTSFGSSICTITFGDQSTIQTDLTVTNIAGKPDHLKVHGNLHGIKYRVTTDDSFACPSVGEYSNGSYHAKGATLKAYKDTAHKEQVTLTVETEP